MSVCSRAHLYLINDRNIYALHQICHLYRARRVLRRGHDAPLLPCTHAEHPPLRLAGMSAASISDPIACHLTMQHAAACAAPRLCL